MSEIILSVEGATMELLDSKTAILRVSDPQEMKAAITRIEILLADGSWVDIGDDPIDLIRLNDSAIRVWCNNTGDVAINGKTRAFIDGSEIMADGEQSWYAAPKTGHSVLFSITPVISGNHTFRTELYGEAA